MSIEQTQSMRIMKLRFDLLVYIFGAGTLQKMYPDMCPQTPLTLFVPVPKHCKRYLFYSTKPLSFQNIVTIPANSGSVVSQKKVDKRTGASEVRLAVLKTKSNLIFEVLAQFSGVTSGTSSGSANVISTH